MPGSWNRDDLIYLAGIIDGEGSIEARCQRRKRSTAVASPENSAERERLEREIARLKKECV